MWVGMVRCRPTPAALLTLALPHPAPPPQVAPKLDAVAAVLAAGVRDAKTENTRRAHLRAAVQVGHAAATHQRLMCAIALNQTNTADKSLHRLTHASRHARAC